MTAARLRAGRGRSRWWLIASVLLTLSGGWASAQEAPPAPEPADATIVASDEVPVVVFIEEPGALRMASLTDPGPDGVTALGAVFDRLGAQTEWQRLREPLPLGVDVIVLVRPLNGVSVDYASRIWARVQQGANLLIAFEPSGPNRANTDSPNSALSQLFAQDYGLLPLPGVLFQTWTTPATVIEPRTSLMAVRAANDFSNPISAPLAIYDVPVMTWGARHLSVESIGLNSIASTLLVSPAVYAEAGAVFGQNPVVEVNIGVDATGRLAIAAIGENRVNRTRLALLADGETLENDFGLATTRTAQGASPAFPGNALLADRLAAWLLELPFEVYPALPAGFTWLVIDGNAADWSSALPSVTSDNLTVELPYRIRQARAFRNDSYLYAVIETGELPKADAQLIFSLDADNDATAETIIVARAGEVVQIVASADGLTREARPIHDAAFAIGSAIEVRLPLRVTGIAPRVGQLCVSNAAQNIAADCLSGTLLVPELPERDPAETRALGMTATVRTNDIANVRAAPNTNAGVVVSLRNNRLVEAIGRTEAADWIQVRSARFEGWMAAFLVNLGGDPLALPVTDGTATAP